MKPLSIQIVPAQPGFFTVIASEDMKAVEACEPVIAWRIETHSKAEGDEVFSICAALTVDGDVDANCIGVQNPDNTVTVFQEKTYRSVEELQATRYPKD